MPDATLEANVASIFKKGDTKKLENYRPISLLTTFYKIIASGTQVRLAAGLDHIVQPTQYGFRANRSTSQALYLARRAQDLAEQSGIHLNMALLDWEKAFDKVDQARMAEALRRLDIPEK